jgi:spore coat protein U-like protein
MKLKFNILFLLFIGLFCNRLNALTSAAPFTVFLHTAYSNQSCSFSSNTTINFGNINLATSGNQSVVGGVQIVCSSPPTLTLMADAGDVSGSTIRRRLLKHSSADKYLEFNLYTDTTLVNILGDETDGLFLNVSHSTLTTLNIGIVGVFNLAKNASYNLYPKAGVYSSNIKLKLVY